MSGADPIAMRDRGEALHVGVEQLGKGRRLSLAQLRKLLGDRLNGAVVLAELGAGGDRVDRRGIALSGQRARELPGVDTVLRIEPRADPFGQLSRASAGELLDRSLTALLGEKAQGACCQIVVRARPSGVTRRR